MLALLTPSRHFFPKVTLHSPRGIIQVPASFLGPQGRLRQLQPPNCYLLTEEGTSQKNKSQGRQVTCQELQSFRSQMIPGLPISKPVLFLPYICAKGRNLWIWCHLCPTELQTDAKIIRMRMCSENWIECLNSTRQHSNLLVWSEWNADGGTLAGALRLSLPSGKALCAHLHWGLISKRSSWHFHACEKSSN